MFLIVTVPENNTTRDCCLCFRPTGFANKREEIRSKVCKDCPVAGRDFFYDRDDGAASNIHFKATFFVRSGGFYPPQFLPEKELAQQRKLFAEFRSKINEEREAKDGREEASKVAP
jgi:hypothetical protein